MDGVFFGISAAKMLRQWGYFLGCLGEYVRIASSVIKYDWLGHSLLNDYMNGKSIELKGIGRKFMNFPASHVWLRHGMQENNILYIYTYQTGVK